MAQHCAEKLEVLIDDGSNNNFIQEALVGRLGLKWEAAKRFKVYMGNRQHLVCDKKYIGAELVMQGISFVAELFVLSVWRLDVVSSM